MSTITMNFKPAYTHARRQSSRSVWRNVGLGLGVALLGLAMTVFGTPHGTLNGTLNGSLTQTGGAWSGVQASPPAGPVEIGTPLAPFPVGVLPAP